MKTNYLPLKTVTLLWALLLLAISSMGQAVNTNICPGGSAVLNATGGGTYAWSTSETTASITVTAAGIYKVTVTAGGGGSTTYYNTVTVNPISPDYLGLVGQASQPSGTGFNKLQSVTVLGNFAYVTSGATPGGLSIYDISIPASPILKGSVSTFGAYMSVVSGTTAYQGGSNSKIYIMDVSNPISPTIYSGTITLTGASNIFNLCLSGSYLYAATLGAGLEAVDVSSNTSPVLHYTEGGVVRSAGVAVSGTTLYTTTYAISSTLVSYLKTWDISSPGSPVLLNTYTIPVSGCKPTELKVIGNYAYVRDIANNKVDIIDITTPTSPVYLSSMSPSYGYYNNAGNFYISGNYAYLFSGTLAGAIDIYDITSKTSPVLVSTTQTEPSGGVFAGGTVAGGYIYDADYGAGGGISGHLSVYRIPTLNHNDTLCAGDSTTLIAPAGVGYTWSPGDTTSGIKVNATGIYNVTVTNSTGCTAVVSDTVTILPSPTVNNAAICAGATATLTVTGGGTYLWSTGATTASITSDTAGTFTVTVTNVLGCSATASGTVVVNVNPVVAVNNDTVCAGIAAMLTATGGVSYAWSTGSTTASITETTAGVYTVTATNAGGCTAIDSGLVVVNPAPTGMVNNDTICAGDTATLTATGGGTYLWSTGATTAGITSDTAGIFTVTVTNSSGCSATAGGTVVVNAVPNVTVNNDTICAGTSAVLTATGGTTYLWSTSATTAVITPSASGIYTVTATSAGGCTAIASGEVVINNLNAAITFGDSSFCVGTRIRIFGTGTGLYGNMIIDDTTVLGVAPISIYTAGVTTHVLGTSDIGMHHITFIVYSANPFDSSGYCTDTVYATPTVRNCLCDSLHAKITTNDTLFCVGNTAHISFSGGPYGQFTGSKTSDIMPIDSFPPITFTFADSNIGTQTLMFVVYSADPDSVDVFCSDTAYVTIVVKNCNCDSLNARITFTDTSFCIGDSFLIYCTGNGLYGQLIIDDTTGTGVGLLSDFASGLPVALHSEDIGQHHLVFIVYTANPDSTSNFCADTAYANPIVKRCNCVGYIPTMASQQTGPMTWQYWSTGSPSPTFLQWFVDTTLIIQTTASDTFTYTFTTEATHHVCMTAGYITPKGDGTALCCYETTCDSVLIDFCNIWRNTDSIGYTLDSLDYHIVHYAYYGAPPTSIMWVFDNGDTIIGNSTSVTDSFASGMHHMCAYIVWSLHDSTNCCCVDTICLDNIDISPCGLIHNSIITDTSGGSVSFMPSFMGGTYGSYNFAISVKWLLNGVPDHNGTIYTPIVSTSGTYTIGMIVEYSISWAGGGNKGVCADTIYDNYFLRGGSERAAFKPYPNPTGGKFVVEITSYGESTTAKFDVMDLTGRTMTQKTITDIRKGTTNVYMDISSLPQGIYELRMTMGNATQVNKLIKQ